MHYQREVGSESVTFILISCFQFVLNMSINGIMSSLVILVEKVIA